MKYRCNAAWKYVPMFGTLGRMEGFAEEDLDLGAMIHSRKNTHSFAKLFAKNIQISLNGLLNVSSRVKSIF